VWNKAIDMGGILESFENVNDSFFPSSLSKYVAEFVVGLPYH
jgi:hypothetical protein